MGVPVHGCAACAGHLIALGWLTTYAAFARDLRNAWWMCLSAKPLLPLRQPDAFTGRHDAHATGPRASGDVVIRDPAVGRVARVG